MKAIGTIKITEELTLLNPSLEIKSVSYDWVNKTVEVVCLFAENNGLFNHERSFVYSTDGKGELTSNDIIDFIKNDEALKVFV